MALQINSKSREELQIQENWFAVRRFVKEKFNKRPDINAILFLIGINELGFVKENWGKEEKQDLMHIAICTLFPENYSFSKKDEDGWLHFKNIKPIQNMLLKEQENVLKQKIIEYFIENGYI